ncbi:MAG: hypothetical protein KGN02_14160, partial [bacterium]|nr:hypothetical protein [bacterium]
IYRPRYTIEELRAEPRFSYLGGVLVQSFADDDEGVRLHFVARDGTTQTLVARRVVLAAGALNSARIALHSRGLVGVRQPLLCNEMLFAVGLNRAMLGRPARDRRHSLGQLLGLYSPPYRDGEHTAVALYSYRSLLNVRLAMEFPTPAWLGVLAARLMTTALTIAGIHFPDRRSETKWIALASDGNALEAAYELAEDERHANARDVAGIVGVLHDIGVTTLRRSPTPHGASIHYAGTLPMRAPGETAPLQTDGDGRLIGSERVFVADSATWRHLPAKSLTLTIMANARRVARCALNDLRGVAAR